MKKIICDHCGKEINETDDYVDYEIEFEGSLYPCDLCAKCKGEICKTLDAEIEDYIGGST